MLGASGASVAVDGSWLSTECTAFNSNRDQLTTLTFDGNSFTNTRQEWATGDKCSGTVLADRVITGSLSIGDAADLDFGKDTVMGNQADFTPTSALRTVYDADLVDGFNNAVVCGYDDWEVDVAKDIIDSTDDNCLFEDAYRLAFFVDDEADPNVLYRADSVAATDDYPTTLVDDYPFEKQ